MEDLWLKKTQLLMFSAILCLYKHFVFSNTLLLLIHLAVNVCKKHVYLKKDVNTFF